MSSASGGKTDGHCTKYVCSNELNYWTLMGAILMWHDILELTHKHRFWKTEQSKKTGGWA